MSSEEASKGHRGSENVCSDWSSLEWPLNRERGRGSVRVH